MSDYLAAARVALEDHPQWLEKLVVEVASQERLGYGSSYAEALSDLIEQPLPGPLYHAVTGHWPTGGHTGAGLADSTSTTRVLAWSATSSR